MGRSRKWRQPEPGQELADGEAQGAQHRGRLGALGFRLGGQARKTYIRVRATDEKGNTQPDEVPFNQQGYFKTRWWITR